MDGQGPTQGQGQLCNGDFRIIRTLPYPRLDRQGRVFELDTGQGHIDILVEDPDLLCFRPAYDTALAPVDDARFLIQIDRTHDMRSLS